MSVDRHACIHTFIHTYVHTYIRSYVHTYVHTCMHSSPSSYTETNLQCVKNAVIPHYHHLKSYIIQIICLLQTTNTISFLFSLFGTGMVIKKFGLTATLIAFPALMLVCTALVWVSPNIWVRESAWCMMYALVLKHSLK